MTGADLAAGSTVRTGRCGVVPRARRGRARLRVRGRGARAYVAVSAGSTRCRVQLGSRATLRPGIALGGFDGRPIAAGDVLPVGPGAGRPGGWYAELRRQLSRRLEVRVVIGIRPIPVPGEGRESFLSTTWKRHAGRRPSRLPLRRRQARDRGRTPPFGAEPGPVEHRRRAVPDQVHPGARRRQTDHPAPATPSPAAALHDDRGDGDQPGDLDVVAQSAEDRPSSSRSPSTGPRRTP
ncbi:biotin-dependent carboxyltransferase family protein [Pseudonocardia sp. MCCB 268]|nr:biotin-dependent carboxyltransferase family protein [Pseudonocardia cytotoxica]